MRVGHFDDLRLPAGLSGHPGAAVPPLLQAGQSARRNYSNQRWAAPAQTRLTLAMSEMSKMSKILDHKSVHINTSLSFTN